MKAGRRGSCVAEALVAAALVGAALTALVSTAGVAVRSLRLARDTGSALALATGRLEALRAGQRTDGADVAPGPDGTAFIRRWSATGGRGQPARLEVSVTWGTRTVALATEALP